ncbi:MAG: cytochrome c [Gammaproteobacteria bacterium]|nr:cytochrome c [Gammaproteobacteria bacterium]
MKKKVFTFISAVFLVSVMGQAHALDGAAIYKNPAKGGCSACHGKDANSPILPSYPKLAGQNEVYILQQLKDIKSGKRNNGMTAAMKGIMHLVNDEEMAALAKYISSLKP